MKYEIVLTDTAREHYWGLDARRRPSIKKGLKEHLSFSCSQAWSLGASTNGITSS
uniref:mRNA interferase RelE/StbE n=1 Tax=Candidatus Kentrum sp. TC TaxID=2126339 RepID=A0A450YSX3_9GAMM|nr:MAG: hypothetical protein BECKTC1821E_GA0114239_103816 [Candidatus Kentron sp. TC]